MSRLLERARVDAILHCAARSLVGESMRDPARYYRDNVAGGIALLEAARQAGVGRIVFSSTAAVYGVPDATPIPEDAPLRPINTYGETKRTFEGALRFYGEAYGLRSVSLRYFNVAGATERNGELHDPETHLIPNLLRAAETGEPITLFGDDYPTPDGTCIRDYIHVADLADAHLAALEATAPDDRADRRGARLQPRDRGGVQRPPGRRRGRGGRRPADPRDDGPAPGRAIRRSSSRPPTGPERSSAGPHARPTLEEMIGSAWAWRRANLDGDGGATGVGSAGQRGSIGAAAGDSRSGGAITTGSSRSAPVVVDRAGSGGSR